MIILAKASKISTIWFLISSFQSNIQLKIWKPHTQLLNLFKSHFIKLEEAAQLYTNLFSMIPYYEQWVLITICSKITLAKINVFLNYYTEEKIILEVGMNYLMLLWVVEMKWGLNLTHMKVPDMEGYWKLPSFSFSITMMNGGLQKCGLST
jgi:hypothetical protein